MGNNLVGSLPPNSNSDFYDALESLETLSLSQNQLEGCLPAELERFNKLQTLLLDHNQFDGSVPGQLGNLTNLQRMDLSFNQLECFKPGLETLCAIGAQVTANNNPGGLDWNAFCATGAGTCPESGVLETLYNATDGPNWNDNTNWLNGGDPCDPDAPWFGITCDCKGSITKISLPNNNLIGFIPPGLGDLTKLDYLELRLNQLSGSIPSELGDLAKLEYLGLLSNQLSGSIPSVLGNLTNLETLLLNDNQLSCLEAGLINLCNNGVLTLVNVANNPGNLDWDAFCATGVGICEGEGVQVSPIVFLQGPYSPSTGLMRDLLRSNGILPFNEPYTGLGYTHIDGGGEFVAPSVFNVVGPDAIVDWVFVELRDKTDYAIVKATLSALLQADGDVVDVDGVSPLTFPTAPDDDYYLVVKHRNHLGVMSATSVAMSSLPVVVDFTSNLNNIFGGVNGIATLDDGAFGLYSGDFNHSGQIQNTDFNFMIPTLGVPAGYLPGDHDLNGQVQNTDLQLKLIPNIGRGQPFGL